MTQPRLRILFCDHLNLARSKTVPAGSNLSSEARFCQGVFAVTYDKDLIPAPGSKMLEGLPDLIGRIDPAQIRPDWQPNSSVAIADLFETDGSPLPMCGRGLLKRTIKQWNELGYQPKVGIELEAYSFTITDGGQVEPLDTPGAYVYSTGPFADPAGFTDAIWERAHQAGFQLEMITSEYDSPQFEFTLRYDDALKAVDDIFLFRLLARETALEFGILLTFVPKAIAEKGGSGFHVNFSLSNEDGTNCILDPSQPDEMSEVAKGAIAGLIHHHQGMSALLAPCVNSYDRLQPASLSGYWANWAEDHRGVTTRISKESVERARIEHRMGDGAANPYTLVSTVLQAARLGVVNGYTLPPAETGDCFESQDAEIGAPESLAAALDALEADTILTEAVGKTLVDNLVFIKRDEIEKTAGLEGQSLRDYYIYYI